MSQGFAFIAGLHTYRSNPIKNHVPTRPTQAVHQSRESIVDAAVKDNPNASVEGVIDDILIRFGMKILDIVPGRVSTETDARLSFDTQGTIDKARELIALYEKNDISRDRVLIKIASTWEGIKAAEVLEKEGIHCNLTLLFSLCQAVACADAKVQLISPFVGRIYDWYKAKTGEEYTGADDPGVQSVQEIYSYYKKFEFPQCRTNPRTRRLRPADDLSEASRSAAKQRRRRAAQARSENG